MSDSILPETANDAPVSTQAFVVDLTSTAFTPITELFSEKKNSAFSDPTYYKSALSGEDESAQRLHNLLSKYLTCQDAKDRTVYRQQMVNAYYDFLRSVAPKMSNPGIALSKRMLMRFGAVLPSLFSPEQKDLFATAFVENIRNEPVYYLDEWFRDIGTGAVTLSATDEGRPTRKPTPGSAEEAQRLQQLHSKNSGKLQQAEATLTQKEGERGMVEAELKSRIEILCDHPPLIGYEPHKQPYSDSQRKLMSEINERMKYLLKIDKDIQSSLKEFQAAKEIDDSLRQKMTVNPVADVSNEDVYTELGTIRQMSKMTVGRQGNQFPIFTREFYHCIPKGTGFRECVLEELRWVESLDPGAFCRIHKNQSHRIVPYVILVPTYGDTGFCWEPFDRYNRITSRGRIVVPMYPKNLRIAVLSAVADLRWQVAKEKASYYWMEEGITGQYYQWIESQKLKGDLKDLFVQDYILWMTKEADGVQRMDKELRGIFWRNLPFPQERKDMLKLRSLVYQELCQKDANRAMSDGY
ncbi:MAG: hypothetical protein MJ178_04635 [Treponemataceae bacterium]|nr:hypothetical protein [Treponemataceae bacterium]